ncbi:MAG: hypothetical protein IPP61_17705 [Cytophagaceae bacterium]|nr:hypothetical protein [Cytophagaceae bacterium]MBK9935957.1 hypothetical protein [Cytophagaceae bacterium]MBL0304161.1 hypothetical protein [Cytophagaceae bacterium]MBL0326970.1 hypothetical protein [Cytophagaceae bacterium]
MLKNGYVFENKLFKSKILIALKEIFTQLYRYGCCASAKKDLDKQPTKLKEL